MNTSSTLFGLFLFALAIIILSAMINNSYHKNLLKKKSINQLKKHAFQITQILETLATIQCNRKLYNTIGTHMVNTFEEMKTIDPENPYIEWVMNGLKEIIHQPIKPAPLPTNQQTIREYQSHIIQAQSLLPNLLSLGMISRQQLKTWQLDLKKAHNQIEIDWCINNANQAMQQKNKKKALHSLQAAQSILTRSKYHLPNEKKEIAEKISKKIVAISN